MTEYTPQNLKNICETIKKVTDAADNEGKRFNFSEFNLGQHLVDILSNRQPENKKIITEYFVKLFKATRVFAKQFPQETLQAGIEAASEYHERNIMHFDVAYRTVLSLQSRLSDGQGDHILAQKGYHKAEILDHLSDAYQTALFNNFLYDYDVKNDDTILVCYFTPQAIGPDHICLDLNRVDLEALEKFRHVLWDKSGDHKLPDVVLSRVNTLILEKNLKADQKVNAKAKAELEEAKKLLQQLGIDFKGVTQKTAEDVKNLGQRVEMTEADIAKLKTAVSSLEGNIKDIFGRFSKEAKAIKKLTQYVQNHSSNLPPEKAKLLDKMATMFAGIESDEQLETTKRGFTALVNDWTLEARLIKDVDALIHAKSKTSHISAEKISALKNMAKEAVQKWMTTHDASMGIELGLHSPEARGATAKIIKFGTNIATKASGLPIDAMEDALEGLIETLEGQEGRIADQTGRKMAAVGQMSSNIANLKIEDQTKARQYFHKHILANVLHLLEKPNEIDPSAKSETYYDKGLDCFKKIQPYAQKIYNQTLDIYSEDKDAPQILKEVYTQLKDTKDPSSIIAICLTAYSKQSSLSNSARKAVKGLGLAKKSRSKTDAIELAIELNKKVETIIPQSSEPNIVVRLPSKPPASVAGYPYSKTSNYKNPFN